MSETTEKKPDTASAAVSVEVTLREIVNLIGKMDMRLDAIEKQVSKIDDIQKCIGNLTGRVRVLEKDVREVKEQNGEFEKSAEAINAFYEEMKGNSEKNTKDVALMKRQLEMADYNAKCAETVLMTALESQEELRGKIEDLQIRSMKRNLIFHGIPENYNEDTEEKLRDFFHYQLRINKFIELTNVHRFGKKNTNKPRPIVAVFLYHKDLEMIRESGRMLKGTKYGINEQFPRAVEDRRQLLYPIAKGYKRAGHRVRMVRDKLYVDGELYAAAQENNSYCDQPKKSYSEVAQTPNGGRGFKRSRAPSTPRSQDARQDNTRAPSASRPRYTPPRDDHVFLAPPSTPGRQVEERRAGQLAPPSTPGRPVEKRRAGQLAHPSTPGRPVEERRAGQFVPREHLASVSHLPPSRHESGQFGDGHRIGEMDSSELMKWLSVPPSTPGSDPPVEEQRTAEVVTGQPIASEVTLDNGHSGEGPNDVEMVCGPTNASGPPSTPGNGKSPVEEQGTA